MVSVLPRVSRQCWAVVPEVTLMAACETDVSVCSLSYAPKKLGHPVPIELKVPHPEL